MKKTISVLILIAACLCSLFASDHKGSRQIRTMISPYSFQRFSATNSSTFNSEYGYGMEFAYFRSTYKGVTFGGEIGIFDYSLPQKTESTKSKTMPGIKNGLCVNVPIVVKFGYSTPEHIEKKIKYFVFADIGMRVLHDTDAGQTKDASNVNFDVGVEVGATLDIGKGFCLVLSGEPTFAFSDKNFEKTATENYTDFVCNVNLGIAYNF